VAVGVLVPVVSLRLLEELLILDVGRVQAIIAAVAVVIVAMGVMERPTSGLKAPVAMILALVLALLLLVVEELHLRIVGRG